MSFPDSIPSYVQLLGLSAAIGGGIGGGISTLINYIVNIRDFKNKNKIRLTEEKIELYSYLIFQLDKTRFAWYALETLHKEQPDPNPKEERYVLPDKEGNGTFNEMNKKIEEGYHLFKQEIMKEWIHIITLSHHPSILGKLPALRKMLINEYNDKIIAEYQNLTGNKLEKKE